MPLKTYLDAVFAFIIAFATSMITLLTQEGVQSIADVSQAALLVALFGAILAMVNTMKARLKEAPPKKLKNSSFLQGGFVRSSLLPVLATVGLVALLLSGGCAVFKETAAPVKDCAKIHEMSNQAIGGCYVVIESLADSLDSLADADLISTEREHSLLGDLSKALTLLSEAENLIDLGKSESAENQLLIAKTLIEKVQLIVQESEANE